MINEADVVNAYKFILGREPESDEVIKSHLENFSDVFSLRDDFLNSVEFQNIYGRHFCPTQQLGDENIIPLVLKDKRDRNFANMLLSPKIENIFLEYYIENLLTDRAISLELGVFTGFYFRKIVSKCMRGRHYAVEPCSIYFQKLVKEFKGDHRLMELFASPEEGVYELLNTDQVVKMCKLPKFVKKGNDVLNNGAAPSCQYIKACPLSDELGKEEAFDFVKVSFYGYELQALKAVPERLIINADCCIVVDLKHDEQCTLNYDIQDLFLYLTQKGRRVFFISNYLYNSSYIKDVSALKDRLVKGNMVLISVSPEQMGKQYEHAEKFLDSLVDGYLGHSGSNTEHQILIRKIRSIFELMYS